MSDTDTSASATTPGASLQDLEAAAFREALEEFSPQASGDNGDASRSPKDPPKPKPKEAEAEETEEASDGSDPEEELKATKKAAKKPETLGESWRKVRETRDALKAHEAHLQERERALKARETAAEASGKDLEHLRTKAALFDRVVSGDPEALAGLEIDFEKLTSGYLKAQSGDTTTSRLERELQELKARLARADEEKTKAAQAQEHEQLYRQAVSRLTTAAKADRLLSSFQEAQLVAMGEQIASEFVQDNRAVPPPEEIARLLGQRLRQEYKTAAQRWAELGEDNDGDGKAPAPPAPPARKPSTVSRRDSAERASSRSTPFSPDQEAAEVLATLRGGVA